VTLKNVWKVIKKKNTIYGNSVAIFVTRTNRLTVAALGATGTLTCGGHACTRPKKNEGTAQDLSGNVERLFVQKYIIHQA